MKKYVGKIGNAKVYIEGGEDIKCRQVKPQKKWYKSKTMLLILMTTALFVFYFLIASILGLDFWRLLTVGALTMAIDAKYNP